MVSNQQFRLKWNNHRNTVLQEFETLLHNNNFVDCTIGAEGKYLKAHKIVLSACSPYLQNVFNEHFDKHPVILLKDVSFKELKCMIDYMYCGEVNISECELPSFLRTAQSLKIKGLAEDIGDYDSASDSEHQEITNSYCGSNRSVEPNVEIHDDEPPAKKSAPSLISTNANNNSFSGRKRKTASSFPTTSKTSVDSQIIEKSAAVQITSQSRKLLEISSTNESENHVKVVPSSTTTIENSINKSENTECDKKIVTPSDPLEDKTKHFKEEPIDMDADNEDNSSYEYGNNPCDEIDALNEDSESNCATSGNKFGDVSIGNVSSYSENDANGYLLPSQYPLALLQQYQQQFDQPIEDEVSIFRQHAPTKADPPSAAASKNYSKSSLYAIKNGCYGPFYCPQCNNHYMWKKNLLRHMKLECGKEPSFQCPICPLKTKHKSSLIGHVRNKHFIDLNQAAS